MSQSCQNSRTILRLRPKLTVSSQVPLRGAPVPDRLDPSSSPTNLGMRNFAVILGCAQLCKHILKTPGLVEGKTKNKPAMG